MPRCPPALRRLPVAIAVLPLAAIAAVLAACPATAVAGGKPKVANAEVQVALCGDPAAIERALKLAPRGPPQAVHLFDDAALSLFARGVRIRLRSGPDGDELTLKVADQDCAAVPPALLPRGAGKCEYDLHGDKLAGAVSLSQRIGADAARDLVAGRASLASQLAPAQVGYLRDVVKLWPLPDGVAALGPIALTTWRDAGKRYDVDVTRLPGGDGYVEISRKVAADDVPRARAGLDRDLRQAGVEACADQSAQAVNKLRALQRPR